MPHEISPEELSALLDGELEDARREKVEAHLKGCAECAGLLKRLAAASGEFREHGRAKTPDRVLAPALGEAQRRARPRFWATQWAVALAAAGLLLVGSSLLMKHFMPGIIAQIHGMISGAASNLGR